MQLPSKAWFCFPRCKENVAFCFKCLQGCSGMGWWCSGILSGLLRRRSGVQIPDPPTLEKCAKGIRLCNLLRSTQPNDRETVIEG